MNYFQALVEAADSTLTLLNFGFLSPLPTSGTCVAHAITVRKLAAWASISARSAMPSSMSSHWSLRMTPIIQTTLTATIAGQSSHSSCSVQKTAHHVRIDLISTWSGQRVRSPWSSPLCLNAFFVYSKELTAEARELKGELYCLPCHDKMGVPICGACRRPIEGRVVNAMGKQWHVEVCKQHQTQFKTPRLLFWGLCIYLITRSCSWFVIYLEGRSNRNLKFSSNRQITLMPQV